MGYIGRPIGTPGHTTQKLDDPTSIANDGFVMKVATVAISPDAASLALYVDGVRQEAGVAYTVSGSTVTFTGDFTSSNDFHGYVMGDAMYIQTNSVDSDHYVDGSIDNAHLADMAANTVKVRDANSSGVPSDKAVADTQLLIGDGTGFTAAALSGDVTMANTGAVTIANTAVENAMMADDAVDEASLKISNAGSNDQFLQKQSGNTGGLTWAAVTDTNTVDMGDGFVMEDGDGTEVTITENKEMKFVEGTGIDINWTNTSSGTDGDPYDLTIACDLDASELAGSTLASGVTVSSLTSVGILTTLNVNRGTTNSTGVLLERNYAGDAGSYLLDVRTGANETTNPALFVSSAGSGPAAQFTGKVGIGIVSPDGQLHVHSATCGNATAYALADEIIAEGSGHSGISILSGTSSEGGLYFGDSDDTSKAAIRYFHNGDAMIFQANGAEAMRVIKNGDGPNGVLCIGTTDNGAALTVHSDTDGSQFIAEFKHADNHENRHGIRIQSGEATGGGHTNYLMKFYNNSNTLQGVITHAANGSCLFTSGSDYRLKENEVAMSDGLERINQLKPYKFNFKVEPDKVVDGFFAHEVSDIVPEAIVGEKDAMTDVIPEKLWEETDGTYIPEGKSVGDVKEPEQPSTVDPQQIDLGKLVPVLVAAVQELSARLEALES